MEERGRRRRRARPLGTRNFPCCSVFVSSSRLVSPRALRSRAPPPTTPARNARRVRRKLCACAASRSRSTPSPVRSSWPTRAARRRAPPGCHRRPRGSSACATCRAALRELRARPGVRYAVPERPRPRRPGERDAGAVRAQRQGRRRRRPAGRPCSGTSPARSESARRRPGATRSQAGRAGGRGVTRRRARHRRGLRQPPAVQDLPGLRPLPVRQGLRLRRRRPLPVRPQRPRHARRQHDRRGDRQRLRADRPRLRRARDADPRARPRRRGQRDATSPRASASPRAAACRSSTLSLEFDAEVTAADIPQLLDRAGLREAARVARRRGGRQRGQREGRLPGARPRRAVGRRDDRARLPVGVLERRQRAGPRGAGRRQRPRARRRRQLQAGRARRAATSRRSR